MTIRIISLAVVVGMSLGACGQKIDYSQSGVSSSDDPSNGGLLDYLGSAATSATTTVSKPYGSGVVELDWNLDDGKLYSSGVGSSKLTTFYEEYGHTYCFENTKHLHDCQVAKSEIRDKIGSEPVAIQGFQLNFAKQSHNRHGQDYKSYAIEGGWVATAELRFDTASGKMVLGNAAITKMYNGECDLNDTSGYTVGYFDKSRILTGLYLADEYAVNSAAYTDAHMKAARVSYSGIVPDPRVASGSGTDTCSGIYCWKFQNPDKAVTTDWGVSSFQDTDNSTTAKVSSYFGLSNASSVARWDSHVIIGFCIKGYKTEQNDVKRPLVHYAIARTHKPQLVFKR